MSARGRIDALSLDGGTGVSPIAARRDGLALPPMNPLRSTAFVRRSAVC
jgi:hypothetical protein